MFCTDPQMLPGMFVKCGKCRNCRRQRKYLHISRMVAEMKETSNATFVTLTYDTDHQPRDSVGRGILWQDDVQRFFKRLRRSGQKFRYYYVGEYGSRTWRPHYHVALFGHVNCIYGRSRFKKLRHQSKAYCCGPCNRIRDAWQNGLIELGDLTPKSIGYISGYISKGYAQKGNPALEGRPPEFSRCSLRPGLGYIYALRTIRAIAREKGEELRSWHIPAGFEHNGQQYAFDRYLRRLMRRWAGFEEKIPQAEFDDYMESYSTLPFVHSPQGPTKALLAEWEGPRRRYEAKEKVKHETLEALIK